jgi:hypothetical protein
MKFGRGGFTATMNVSSPIKPGWRRRICAPIQALMACQLALSGTPTRSYSGHDTAKGMGCGAGWAGAGWQEPLLRRKSDVPSLSGGESVPHTLCSRAFVIVQYHPDLRFINQLFCQFIVLCRSVSSGTIRH